MTSFGKSSPCGAILPLNLLILDGRLRIVMGNSTLTTKFVHGLG